MSDDQGTLDQTEERSSRSHSHLTTWMISLLAVPVLYVLTFPPLVMSVMKPHSTPPRWLVVYGGPIQWMHGNMPIQKPLNAYAKWWADVLDYKGPI